MNYSVPRRIGICADDFGFHLGINQAIVTLARQGCLSAASCMTEGPALPASSRALKNLQIDIGVHLNFTESFANSAPNKIPLKTLILQAFSQRLNYNTTRKTIIDQLNRFEKIFDQPPDFIDGHQHVHQLPIIREALFDVLNERYDTNPWIRNTRPLFAGPLRIGVRMWFKSNVIQFLGGRALERQAKRAGFSMNSRFLGVYGFDLDASGYFAALDLWFSGCESGDLLMCHPGLSAPIFDGIAAARAVEFSVFAHAKFKELLNKHRIEIVQLSQFRSAHA